MCFFSFYFPPNVCICLVSPVGDTWPVSVGVEPFFHSDIITCVIGFTSVSVLMRGCKDFTPLPLFSVFGRMVMSYLFISCPRIGKQVLLLEICL